MTISGISLTMTSTAVLATGPLTNKKTAGGEHYIHLLGKIHYTNVTANHGCRVFSDQHTLMSEETEGTITTEELTATTEGQGDAAKLTARSAMEPEGSNVFARFWLTGCEVESLNGTYTVNGGLNTTSIEGATSRFTHANTTEQGTLTLNGNVIPVGIEGSLTLKGKDTAKGDVSYTPITATTVETP